MHQNSPLLGARTPPGWGDTRSSPVSIYRFKSGVLGVFEMLGASSHKKIKTFFRGREKPQRAGSPSLCSDPRTPEPGCLPNLSAHHFGSGSPRQGAVNPQIPPSGESERLKACLVWGKRSWGRRGNNWERTPGRGRQRSAPGAGKGSEPGMGREAPGRGDPALQGKEEALPCRILPAWFAPHGNIQQELPKPPFPGSRIPASASPARRCCQTPPRLRALN